MVYISLKFLLICFLFQSVRGQKLQQDCNVPARGAVPTVSNGQAVPDRYYPWHVAIFKKGGLGRYICGGSIINNQFILTAAHCLYEENKVVIEDRLFIRAGSNKREGGDYYEVHKTIIHKDFNRFNFQADIALIQTATQIQFSRLVKPVCYTRTDFLYVNKDAWIPGWGITENQTDGVTEDLNHVKMPGRTGDTCKEQNPDFYNAYANNYNFCAGHADGTSICTGDSGGGLVMKHNNGWYIRGIASLVVRSQFGFVNVCDLSQFALFTDVASFADWIDANSLSKEQLDGISTRKSGRRRRRKSEIACDAYIEDRSVIFQDQQINNNISFRAVESAKEFPSNCFYQHFNGLCACTLISNRWVLTLALCVESIPHFVLLGAYNISDARLTGIRVAVEERISPVNDLGKTQIALVKLAVSVTFTDEIYPACLYADNNGPAAETELFFAGIGFRNRNRQISQVLIQKNQKVDATSRCYPYEICASGITESICGGDRGGPLLSLLNEEKRVFAVVGIAYQSSNKFCRKHYRSKFVRISYVLDWIEGLVWPDRPEESIF